MREKKNKKKNPADSDEGRYFYIYLFVFFFYITVPFHRPLKKISARALIAENNINKTANAREYIIRITPPRRGPRRRYADYKIIHGAEVRTQ